MSQGFNINARLVLDGPYNVQKVVAEARRQVQGGIKGQVDFQVTPGAGKAIQGVAAAADAAGRSARAAAVNVRGLAKDAQSVVFNADVINVTGKIGRGMDDAAKRTKGLKAEVDRAKSAAERMGEEFGAVARRYGAFLLVARSFQVLTASIGDSIREAVLFQNEMVRLTQIGGTSSRAVADIGAEIGRLATSLGASSRDLSQVAVTLRQAGLSANETKTALDALAKTSLAPTFESIQSTTEGVVAMRQQFGVSADEIAARLGSINTVAGEFAVESEDLVTAIKKAGGAFKAASGDMVSGEQSFNQLLALFTSVRNTTRESADEIATGMRTIFARVQSNSVANALDEMGVKLRFTREESQAFGRDVTGQFVGAYEAVRRLQAATKGLPTTDPRFAQIVEQLGGFRQISRVIPLLQQGATAQKAYMTAQAGANSLSIDAAKAQDSLIVRTARLKEEVMDLVRAFGENKGLQAMATTFLDLAQAGVKLAKALEPLIPMLAVVGAAKTFTGYRDFARGSSAKLFGVRPVDPVTNKPADLPVRPLLRRQRGGVIPGSGRGDKIPITARPGGFVVKGDSSRKIGHDRLAALDLAASRGSGGTSDGFTILTEPGEYYFQPEAVARIGLARLERVNRTGRIGGPDGYNSGGRVRIPSGRTLDLEKIKRLRNLGVAGGTMQVDGVSRVRRRFEVDPETGQPTPRARFYAKSRSIRYAASNIGMPVPDHVLGLIGRSGVRPDREQIRKMLGFSIGGETNPEELRKRLEKLGVDPSLMAYAAEILPYLDDQGGISVGQGGAATKATRAFRGVAKSAISSGDPLGRALNVLAGTSSVKGATNAFNILVGRNNAGGRLKTVTEAQKKGVRTVGGIEAMGYEGINAAIARKLAEVVKNDRQKAIKKTSEDGPPQRYIDTLSRIESGDPKGLNREIFPSTAPVSFGKVVASGTGYVGGRSAADSLDVDSIADDILQNDLVDERDKTGMTARQASIAADRARKKFDGPSYVAVSQDVKVPAGMGLSGRLGRTARPVAAGGGAGSPPPTPPAPAFVPETVEPQAFLQTAPVEEVERRKNVALSRRVSGAALGRGRNRAAGSEIPPAPSPRGGELVLYRQGGTGLAERMTPGTTAVARVEARTARDLARSVDRFGRSVDEDGRQRRLQIEHDDAVDVDYRREAGTSRIPDSPRGFMSPDERLNRLRRNQGSAAFDGTFYRTGTEVELYGRGAGFSPFQRSSMEALARVAARRTQDNSLGPIPVPVPSIRLDPDPDPNQPPVPPRIDPIPLASGISLSEKMARARRMGLDDVYGLSTGRSIVPPRFKSKELPPEGPAPVGFDPYEDYQRGRRTRRPQLLAQMGVGSGRGLAEYQDRNATRIRASLEAKYFERLKKTRVGVDMSEEDARGYARKAVERRERRGGISGVSDSLANFISADLRRRGVTGERFEAGFQSKFAAATDGGDERRGLENYHAEQLRQQRPELSGERRERAARALADRDLRNKAVVVRTERGVQFVEQYDAKRSTYAPPKGGSAKAVDEAPSKPPKKSLFGRMARSASEKGVRGAGFAAQGGIGVVAAASLLAGQEPPSDGPDTAEGLERTRSSRKFRGGLTFGSLGAQFGMMSGVPGGAVIGGLAGAAYGSLNSLKELDREIAQLRLADSLRKLGTLVDDVAEGRRSAPGITSGINAQVRDVQAMTVGSVDASGAGTNWADSLDDFMRNQLGNAAASAGGVLGRATGDALKFPGSVLRKLSGASDEEIQKDSFLYSEAGFGTSSLDREKGRRDARLAKERETLSPILPNLRQAFQLSLTKHAEADPRLAEGDPDARRARRRQAVLADGGREFVETVARVQKTSIERVIGEFEQNLAQSIEASRIQESGRELADAVELQVRRFERLGSALETASASLQGLRDESSALDALASGRAGTASFSGLSERLNSANGVDPATGKAAESFVKGSLGPVGAGIYGDFAKTVAEMDRARRELAGQLVEATRGGSYDEDSIIGEASNAFSSYDNETKAKFQGKLNTMDSKTVLQELTANPEKLAQQLVDSVFDDVDRVRKSIVKNLEDRFKDYADGLGRANELDQVADATLERTNEMGLTQGGLKVDLFKAATGRDASLSYEDLTAPFRAKQANLAGDVGESATGIRDRLKSVEERALAAQKTISAPETGIEERRRAQEEFVRLTQQSSDLVKALEGLADSSSRLSAIQTKIAEEEKVRSSKLSLAERLLTNDPRANADFQKGLYGAEIAGVQGDFSGFSSENIKLVLETLRAFGDVEFDQGPFKGFTGTGAAEKLVGRSGVLQGVPVDDSKLVGLRGQAVDIQQGAVDANLLLGGVQKGQAGRFRANRESEFAEARKRADEELARNERRDAEEKALVARSELGRRSASLSLAERVDERYAARPGDDGLARARRLNAVPDLAEFAQDLEDKATLEKAGIDFSSKKLGVGLGFGDGVDVSGPEARDKFLNSYSSRFDNSRGLVAQNAGLPTRVVDDAFTALFAQIRQKADDSKNLAGFDPEAAFRQALKDASGAEARKLTQGVSDRRARIAGDVGYGIDERSLRTIDSAARNRDELDKDVRGLEGVGTLEDARKKFGEQEVSLGQAADKLASATSQLANVLNAGNLVGPPQYRAGGGPIFRRRGTDTVPAMLSPDEHVVKARSARANRPLLDLINSANGPVDFGRMAALTSMRSTGALKGLESTIGSTSRAYDLIRKEDEERAARAAVVSDRVGVAKSDAFVRADALSRRDAGAGRIGPSAETLARIKADREGRVGPPDVRRRRRRRYRQDAGSSANLAGAWGFPTQVPTPPRRSRYRNTDDYSNNLAGAWGWPFFFAEGGVVPRRPLVRPPGGRGIAAAIDRDYPLGGDGGWSPRGTDVVPAMLTKGEYVVDRETTKAHLPLLRSLKPEYRENGGRIGTRLSNQEGHAAKAPVVVAEKSAPKAPAPPAVDLSGPASLFGDAVDSFDRSQKALVTGLDRFAQSWDRALPAFNQSVDRLAASIASMPNKMVFEGRHSVEVLLNGGQVLAAMKGDMAEEVARQFVVELESQVRRIVNDMPLRI